MLPAQYAARILDGSGEAVHVIVAVHVGNNFSRLNSPGSRDFDLVGKSRSRSDGLTLVNGQPGLVTAFTRGDSLG